MFENKLYVINLFGFKYRYEIVFEKKNFFLNAVFLVWFLLTYTLETVARRYNPDNSTQTYLERLIVFTMSFCFLLFYLLGQET